jgi:hypothetical protein
MMALSVDVRGCASEFITRLEIPNQLNILSRGLNQFLNLPTGSTSWLLVSARLLYLQL